MAPQVIPIPLRTLNAGPQAPIDAPVPAGKTGAEFLINRNVGAFPLDGDPARSLAVDLFVSWDGGATWKRECSTTLQGGVITDTDTGVRVFDTFGASGIAPGATHARLAAVVTGTVSISGTLTLTP
jgi:hypothetical protein